MDRGSRLAWSTMVIVAVASAIVSGPLVGAVDLTPAPAAPAPPPGSGSADIRVDAVAPDAVALERGRFGSGTFHLVGPPAVVTVVAVEGNPVLRYAIDVPELWFSEVNTYELAGTEGEVLRLSFRPVELSPRLVTADSYDATLAIWLRHDRNAYDTLYQARITLAVRR